jgi:hypothetical protein
LGGHRRLIFSLHPSPLKLTPRITQSVGDVPKQEATKVRLTEASHEPVAAARDCG